MSFCNIDNIYGIRWDEITNLVWKEQKKTKDWALGHARVWEKKQNEQRMLRGKKPKVGENQHNSVSQKAGELISILKGSPWATV